MLEKRTGLRTRILLAYVAKHGEHPPGGSAFADFVAGGIEAAGLESPEVQRWAAVVQANLLGVTSAWLLGWPRVAGIAWTEVEARVDLVWWTARIEAGEVEHLPPTAELAERWGWTLEEVEQASKRWAREEVRG